MKRLWLWSVLSTLVMAHSGGGGGIFIAFALVIVIIVVALTIATHFIVKMDNKRSVTWYKILPIYFVAFIMVAILLFNTIHINGPLHFIFVFHLLLLPFIAYVIRDNDGVPLGFLNAFWISIGSIAIHLTVISILMPHFLY